MQAFFYKGRDNSVTLKLTTSGVVIPYSEVSRLVIKDGEATIDSQLNPELFEANGDGVKLLFGQVESVSGVHVMKVIAYLPDADDGLVFGEVRFEFRGEA